MAEELRGCSFPVRRLVFSWETAVGEQNSSANDKFTVMLFTCFSAPFYCVITLQDDWLPSKKCRAVGRIFHLVQL
jgi:hypothetical protein